MTRRRSMCAAAAPCLEQLQLHPCRRVIAAGFAAFIAWLIGIAFIRARHRAAHGHLRHADDRPCRGPNWNEDGGAAPWSACRIVPLGGPAGRGGGAGRRRLLSNAAGLLLRCSRGERGPAEASASTSPGALMPSSSALSSSRLAACSRPFPRHRHANSFYLDLTFVTLAMLVVAACAA